MIMRTIREINIETQKELLSKRLDALKRPQQETTAEDIEMDAIIKEALENPITPSKDNRTLHNSTKRGFRVAPDYISIHESEYLQNLRPFKYDDDTDTIITADTTISTLDLFQEIKEFGVNISKIHLLRIKLKNFSE